MYAVFHEIFSVSYHGSIIWKWTKTNDLSTVYKINNCQVTENTTANKHVCNNRYKVMPRL